MFSSFAAWLNSLKPLTFSSAPRVVVCTLALAGFAGCSNLPHSANPWGASADRDLSVPMNVARVHERQGELEKARDLYEQMYVQAPDNPELCHRLMVVLLRLDEHEAAGRMYQRAQQLAPENGMIAADFGYALYLRGDLEQAEQLLRTARSAHPHEKRIASNLALVLGAQGETDEALGLFRNSTTEAEALANMGFVHTQRGEIEQAKRYYSAALTAEPDMKSAQHALLQIAQSQPVTDKAGNVTSHALPTAASFAQAPPAQIPAPAAQLSEQPAQISAPPAPAMTARVDEPTPSLPMAPPATPVQTHIRQASAVIDTETRPTVAVCEDVVIFESTPANFPVDREPTPVSVPVTVDVPVQHSLPPARIKISTPAPDPVIAPAREVPVTAQPTKDNNFVVTTSHTKAAPGWGAPAAPLPASASAQHPVSQHVQHWDGPVITPQTMPAPQPSVQHQGTVLPTPTAPTTDDSNQGVWKSH